MNTIVAESLDFVSTGIEAGLAAGSSFEDALTSVLQGIANDHGAVVFGGNGYSAEWHAEAEERGLPNLRNTVDALPALVEEEAVAVFEKYGVLSEREVHSRYEIWLDRYCLDVNTEALLALEIAKTKILPSCLSYQKSLAELALDLKGLGKTPDLTLLDQVIALTDELKAGIADIEAGLAHESDGDTLAHAKHYRDKVLTAMLKTRAAADELEGIVADELWPLPTYQEMLFIK
jgi:glutamine synthetase